MKRVLFLMVLVGLIGCESGENGLQENNLGVNTTAGLGESIAIRSKESAIDFNITVVSINDSRCPMDAMCFWAGEAVVEFQTEDLNFSLKIGESKEFSPGHLRFRLTLVEVTPYPGAESNDEKTGAVFIVELI